MRFSIFSLCRITTHKWFKEDVIRSLTLILDLAPRLMHSFCNCQTVNETWFRNTGSKPADRRKRFILVWNSGLTSDFRATTGQREGRLQLMVDSNWRDTKGAWKPLRAASALNWAKRRPSLTASTKPAPSPPPSLLTSVQTQSILFLWLTHCHCGTLLPWQQNLGRRFSIFFFLIEAPPLRHPRRNDWKVTSLTALSDSTQIVFSKTLECLLCERHSSAYNMFFSFLPLNTWITHKHPHTHYFTKLAVRVCLHLES